MLPRKIETYALYVALLVAWVAMLGSLYFSEVRHYVPCLWCWYQRILMYPLALILPVGLLRRDEELPYYMLPFSVLGMMASSYHYLLQKTTWFSGTTACSVGVPCNLDYINWLGFITIPFLALIAFVLIFFATVVALTSRDSLWKDEEQIPWQPVAAIIALMALLFTPSFLSATPATEPVRPLSSSVALPGQELYEESCGVCHGLRGEGIEGLAPALAGSARTEETPNKTWIDLVRAGIPADHPDNQSGIAMPPSGGRPDLTEADLAAILDYLRALSEPAE
ncbi:MAG: c-type cytochrome [Ardenticatenales bacterium]|nr:c-type cytochrome [Ardenticatenales bacterium]